MFQLEALDHVALLVQDMERAVKWYQDVFGMQRRYQEVWRGARDPVVMATGNVQIALFLPASPGTLRPHDLNEHFAVRVDRANFEQALFALDVAWRSAEAADGWRTLPSHASWDDALAAGIHLGLCSLHRDAFTLALEDGPGTAGGRLSHIGLQVDAPDLERLRTQVPALGCQLTLDRPTPVVFDDHYGVRWEVTTSSYEDPSRLSTGARTGCWLDVSQQH